MLCSNKSPSHDAFAMPLMVHCKYIIILHACIANVLEIASARQNLVPKIGQNKAIYYGFMMGALDTWESERKRLGEGEIAKFGDNDQIWRLILTTSFFFATNFGAAPQLSTVSGEGDVLSMYVDIQSTAEAYF